MNIPVFTKLGAAILITCDDTYTLGSSEFTQQVVLIIQAYIPSLQELNELEDRRCE
jgi:alpha-glucosidase (family GH31 glycosyl hydrolase)